MKSIIVWGGSGQLTVLEEFSNQTGFEIKAIFDNNEVPCPLDNVPIFYGKDSIYEYFKKHTPTDYGFIVAIGGANGVERVEISIFLEKMGLTPVDAIHPNSYTAKSSVIQTGCQIMANATVGAKATIGKFCILNTGSVVDHECTLGTGVHIGPGATLAGLVEVGDYSFIGAGAVILPRVKIGRNSIVGAGSVVTNHVLDNVVCYGNPARIKSYRETLK
ncbi:MAG: acetyltransferase [Pseudomonadales bacterium]|nr:acetyltransferase [Pseudomonadales bacterium]